MQTFGNQLRIFVPDAGTAIGRVQAALAEHGIAVLDVRRTQPRMEEAFISLVRRQEARPKNGQRQSGAKTA
jgi:hypothetical protein